MALNLEHQTIPEFLTRLRDDYKQLSRCDLARVAYWLYEWFVANDITAEQIKDAWGLNDAQWLVLRDKVIVLHDAWAVIKDETGS